MTFTGFLARIGIGVVYGHDGGHRLRKASEDLQAAAVRAINVGQDMVHSGDEDAHEGRVARRLDAIDEAFRKVRARDQ